MKHLLIVLSLLASNQALAETPAYMVPIIELLLNEDKPEIEPCYEDQYSETKHYKEHLCVQAAQTMDRQRNACTTNNAILFDNAKEKISRCEYYSKASIYNCEGFAQSRNEIYSCPNLETLGGI